MRLFLLLCACLPLSLLAQGGLPTQPYIYVEGKAEIEKAADIVTLRFDLVARNADQAKANQQVQGRAAKIFEMLGERKVAASDVVASDLKSDPQFADPNSQRGKIIGYSVTRTFEVIVRELPAFPKLVDELMNVSGVEFSGIDGGLSSQKEFRDDLRSKALEDARDQAEKTLRVRG